jgi:hypothetical protein
MELERWDKKRTQDAVGIIPWTCVYFKKEKKWEGNLNGWYQENGEWQYDDFQMIQELVDEGFEIKK